MLNCDVSYSTGGRTLHFDVHNSFNLLKAAVHTKVHAMYSFFLFAFSPKISLYSGFAT